MKKQLLILIALFWSIGAMAAPASVTIVNLGNSAPVIASITNTGLFFSNATQAFATGTGSSVTITLQVATLIATV